MTDPNQSHESRKPSARLFERVVEYLWGGEQRLFAALMTLQERADNGDRSAKASLRNPWGTSLTPKRAIPLLRRGIAETDEEIGRLGPELLALLLRKKLLADQMEQYSSNASIIPSTGASARLAEAGIADWMVERLSESSLERLAVMITEATRTSTYFNTVGWCDVARFENEIAEERNPQKIKEIDPTRIFVSSRFEVSENRTLPGFYWESVVDFPEFRCFYREAFKSEHYDVDQDAWLPPYETIEEYERYDPEFAMRLAEAREAGQWSEEHIFDDPREEYMIPEEWCFVERLVPRFRAWPALWHAFRPFGEIAVALSRHCGESSPSLFEDWALKVQLFYLFGRHRRFKSEAEKAIRVELFDFLRLPVLTYGAPAVRVLIPKDRLPASR